MAESRTVDHLEVTPAQSDFYRWEVPGKKVSVCLSFDAIDRLVMEVMRGFGAIPRRGAEVGGVLVGSVENDGNTTVVRIEDFEPVHCDHRRGPSFLLADPDAARFTAAISKHQSRVVGVYRSHTREGLGLTPEDLNLFDHYCPDASAVFLLIKPYATKVSQAGFFFREADGSVRTESSYLEFPFRRKELGGGASERPRERGQAPSYEQHSEPRHYDRPSAPEPAYYPDSPASAEELQAALASYPVPPPVADGESAVAKFRRTNVWIPLSFIFLLLGVLVGFQAAIAYRPSRTAGVLNDAYTLGLSVARTGDNLHVRWDRNSHAIRVAQRGVLTITDGTYSTTVDLDVAQLQNPSVFYRNMSSTVRLRLEVFTKERNSVAEVLEWSK